MAWAEANKLVSMKSKKYQQVVVIGSVGFDQIMGLPGVFSDWIMPNKIHKLNVSFTVESLRKEFGGTGGNFAYSMGLLGLSPKLVSVLGKDGEKYKQKLERIGVDVSGLVVDKSMFSASGHVMTDLEDNQLWSYYPGPLGKLNEVERKNEVGKDDLVAMLPSDLGSYSDIIRELVKIGADYMYDPAFFIPNISAKDLRFGIRNAVVVIGNDYEIELMMKKTKMSVKEMSKGGRVVITTLGSKGSKIYYEDEELDVGIAKVKKVVDPTGAGDAFRAGLLTGYLKGFSLKECGQIGAVTAAYAVETYGTQQHMFKVSEFESRYSKNFGESINI